MTKLCNRLSDGTLEVTEDDCWEFFSVCMCPLNFSSMDRVELVAPICGTGTVLAHFIDWMSSNVSKCSPTKVHAKCEVQLF